MNEWIIKKIKLKKNKNSNKKKNKQKNPRKTLRKWKSTETTNFVWIDVVLSKFLLLILNPDEEFHHYF